MAAATIVTRWRENGQVFMAVRVDEGGRRGAVEYIGAVPDDAAFAALSNAEKKAVLVAACKAQRDAAIPPAPPALPSITGSVTV